VNLSRGGGDAVEVREFDLAAKSFLIDGFTLPEAKTTATYVGENTVLFGSDFGKGSLTTSGYPRIVKSWHRGEVIADAKEALEGKAEDVSVSPVSLHQPEGSVPMILRGVSFFEAEYYLPGPDCAWMKLPLPLGADLKGMSNGQIVFTLRSDWTPPGGTKLPRGSLIAFALKDTFDGR
jgi:prolyl oligopeptidase